MKGKLKIDSPFLKIFCKSLGEYKMPGIISLNMTSNRCTIYNIVLLLLWLDLKRVHKIFYRAFELCAHEWFQLLILFTEISELWPSESWPLPQLFNSVARTQYPVRSAVYDPSRPTSVGQPATAAPDSSEFSFPVWLRLRKMHD